MTKHVKESCPNLESYCLFMASNAHKILDAYKVLVERDLDLHLENSRSPKGQFSRLQELHLIGPFESAFVRFAVLGADRLRSLSLGIAWPYTITTQQKNFLGLQFIKEVRTGNPLPLLEELHLFTGADDGRGHRLDPELAYYLATELRSLKHLGSFAFWSLEPFSIRHVMTKVRQINPAITFDDVSSLSNRTSSNKFLECYREDRARLACSWLPLHSPLFQRVNMSMKGRGGN